MIRRHPNLTPNGCRQMATRLGLAEELREFTVLSEVSSEAGVSVQAVHAWLRTRKYRRVCRMYGRELLIPVPVVRLYLHSRRAPSRPRGWWGTARTAAELDCTVGNVHALVRGGRLDTVQHGRTFYVDPHSVAEYQRGQPPEARALDVRVGDLAGWLEVSRPTVDAALRAAGIATALRRTPSGPCRVVSAEAARQFLTARGHREELVETYLRRALVGEAAKSPR